MAAVSKARKPGAREHEQQPEIARGREQDLTAAARKFDSSADALARYFNELQGLPLLGAEQELALAREIEELEIEHWRALLSYRPALDVVRAALEPCLPRRARKLEVLSTRARAPRGRGRPAAKRGPRRVPAVMAAAQELRALDPNRSALKEADAAVREAFAGRGCARHYLARVARAREAQQRAKGRFVAANLRLVITMARRYGQTLLPLPDLIQEGNLGLMRAVERFDYRRGYRFSTYASWWIRHSLNRALSDKARLVRIPVHRLDDLSRVARAIGASAAKTGAAPSAEELASEIGMSEEKLALLETEGLLKHPVSLDRRLGPEREQTLHDILPCSEQPDPEQTLDLSSWRGDLDHLLRGLTSIEAAILRFRFGLDGGEELTLREIGHKYNLSRERIRQLQEEALGKLRRALERNLSRGDMADGLAARAPSRWNRHWRSARAEWDAAG